MSQNECLPCEDFGEFMDMLQKRRQVDDRIIHEMNTTIPTESFASKMKSAHTSRVNDISKCVTLSAKKVGALKLDQKKDPESYKISKALRNEQTNMRMFQQEINVEEIVWERATKVFNERCRNYYRP